MFQTTGALGWPGARQRPPHSSSSWNLGSSSQVGGIPENFLTWTGPCGKCGKTRRGEVGLFCCNVLIGRESFPPCKAVYCGPCYVEAPHDPFIRLQGFAAADKNDAVDDLEMDADEQKRYQHKRVGDHLMGVPFECDLCHFRNMNRRDPVWGHQKDEDTLMAIRRANLDVCWARESSTVSGNLSRVRRDYLDASDIFSLGKCPLSLLPSPKVEDRVGMSAYLMTLAASLRTGVYATNVHYEIVQKTTSWYSNAYDAGVNYQGTPKLGDKGWSEGFETMCPTNGKWYTRAMRDMKLRMGVLRLQNEALTYEMVLALDILAETEWTGCVNTDYQEMLEELMSYVLFGFGAGLRGEEVPLVSLKGLLTFWEETQSDPDPFIMATLYERFKEKTGYRWHCLPVCDNNRSGIPFRKWIGRLVSRRVNIQGRRDGWLFMRKGRRALIRDYDDAFGNFITQVHAVYPSLFSEGTSMHLFSL